MMENVARPVELRTFAQVEKAIGKSAAESRPLVIKFHAPWCGPCKQIAPWFETFYEDRRRSVDFATVNIDLDDDVATSYDVKIIPAFHVWNRGARVAVFGREPNKISSSVDECLASWKKKYDVSDTTAEIAETIDETPAVVPTLVLPFKQVEQDVFDRDDETVPSHALESIAIEYADTPIDAADTLEYPLLRGGGGVAKKQRRAGITYNEMSRSSSVSESTYLPSLFDMKRAYEFCGC